LEEIGSVMTRSIEEVREIAHNLRPYQLDRLGLTKAIRSLVGTISESSGISFRADIENVDADFSAEESILLYRIVQEAANNVMKHSHSSDAVISVKKNHEMVELIMSDNGKGSLWDKTRKQHGFGLEGIAQR